MRYAVKTPPHHGTWNEYLDLWRAADQMDVFESAWNFDHFYPLSDPFTGPCLEAWTMLAALAQATSRIRIGTMVNAMHHRHPAVTASMAATLDIISAGRFNLGLGAGWNEMENEAYGLDLGSIAKRMDRFEEGVDVVLSLLENETTTHAGSFYTLEDARCEPKGPQRPRMPLVIGGKGKQRTLRLVARHAEAWDCMFVPVDEWQTYRDVLHRHCEDLGRDPGEITTMAHVRWPGDSNPAPLVEQANAYHEVGVDVVVFSGSPPYRTSALEALAAVLGRAA